MKIDFDEALGLYSIASMIATPVLGYMLITADVKTETVPKEVVAIEKIVKAPVKVEEPKVEVAKVEEPKVDSEKEARKQFNKLAGLSFGKCQPLVRASAKYPEKVDIHVFKSGSDKTWWTNGSPEKQGKVTQMIYAEMMNGFGAMLPSKAYCEFNVNLKDNKLELVGFTMDGKKIM